MGGVTYIKVLNINYITQTIRTVIILDQITQIFCSIYDFCSVFIPRCNQQLLAAGKSRIKPS